MEMKAPKTAAIHMWEYESFFFRQAMNRNVPSIVRATPRIEKPMA
jgi:hypothetical protein